VLRFANDGGPLLLAPREPQAAWDGSESDYERACEIQDGAALLPAGNGWVVVMTASAVGLWHPAPPSGVMAVAIGIQDWTEETTSDTIGALYTEFADRPWLVLAEALPLGEGGVALLHAAGVRGQDIEYLHDAEYGRYPGDRGLVFIGDAIVYPLPPGTYRLEAYEHLVRRTPTAPGEHLVLVRFLAGT